MMTENELHERAKAYAVDEDGSTNLDVYHAFMQGYREALALKSQFAREC